MDKQIKRHLDRRGVRLAHGRPAKGLLGMDGGVDAFLKWFYEGVMRFDSMEYRRRFWYEAYRNGHTIGHMPRTAVEFTDPRRHSYNTWLGNLAVLLVTMGASAVVWYLVRTLDAHIRRLRRPTYYEVERKRRMGLAEERRRIRRRTTTSPCPTRDMLRTAFEQARSSTAGMIRFGSMLEDLECYVDNSVVWSEEEGRIVGRRGGIRQWLRENVPELSEHYKTVMKYKALAKKFRQAVGVSDPIPAAAVLPPDSSERDETGKEKGTRDIREYCSEQIRGGQTRKVKEPVKQVRGRPGNQDASGQGHTITFPRAAEEVAQVPEKVVWAPKDVARSTEKVSRTPEAVARELLEACEGTVTSLAAQLELMVSAEFVLDENIGRTKIAHGGGRLRSSTMQRVRSSA